MRISAVLVAAGTGSRMGAGFNKVYMPLAGECVLWHTVKAVAESGVFSELVIVTGREDFEKAEQIASCFDIVYKITEGGATRQESVLNGISVCTGELVAVHDGARALVTPELLRSVADAAIKYGAAALGVMPKDTIKAADADGFIERTIPRESAYQIQTTQVFKKDALIAAHKRAIEDGFAVTDDCMVMEREGVKIKIVEGSYENIKLTTPEDIYTAERILKERGQTK
ncbi:MAG: 2-C-methyl-D-erythritol 4-phosphate cytidylyltransferase [Clostridia bacterium]|nr:2-C-methyl-D-erythritol 4-phosphate cytidylyltransferase [Clostridia bacterium]